MSPDPQTRPTILSVAYHTIPVSGRTGFCGVCGRFEEYFDRLSQEMTLDQIVNDITPTEEDLVLVVRCLGWSAKPLREFLASVQKWVDKGTLGVFLLLNHSILLIVNLSRDQGARLDRD